MGGQVLGGGVIVLVAVALWLVYLLPSWQGRHRYYAAERNAVRLNQALRVLAETSETPQEVRLELNARTAHQQQKLARLAQSEREQAELEAARAQLAAAKEEARTHAALAREQARRYRAQAEAQRWAVLADPAARRARARRRVRIVATAIGILSLALTGWGAVALAQSGSALLLAGGGAGVALALLTLGQMASVQRRGAVRAASSAQLGHVALAVQDVALGDERVAWTPRSLPRPLTASAGSRAAATLDAAREQDRLRQVAQEDAMLARAARTAPGAPTSIEGARRSRDEVAFAGGAGAGDEAIEAHVRALLARRAVGQ